MSMMKFAPCAMLLLVGACGAGGPAKAPEGETDLSCAAGIYAATNLLDSSNPAKAELGTGNYLGAMTKYGTAYAKEKGVDANDALGLIKLEAYRVKDRDSSATIVARAKACAGL